MASRQLEYFYSTHSTYAYIGAMRFQEICATFDCAPVHRPFDFLPVVEHAGGLPFAARTQAHVDYFFGREIERWSVYRDVPIIDHRPTHHDNPLSLSSGMVISAAQSGLDVNALSLAIHQAHWRDDLDLMDLSVLENAAESVGLDARPLLEDAMSPSVKGIFAENTQAAIDRVADSYRALGL